VTELADGSDPGPPTGSGDESIGCPTPVDPLLLQADSLPEGIGHELFIEIVFVSGESGECGPRRTVFVDPSDYRNSRVPLENLGIVRRFPIGRVPLYRNVSGRLPVVSDDISMTC